MHEPAFIQIALCWSGEGAAQTTYEIHKVLWGASMLGPHITTDGPVGRFGSRRFIPLEYLETWLNNRPLPVSGGVSLLFLHAPKV